MDPHPDYVHNMEINLADDLNSDDSATAGWAKKFLIEFESGFFNYEPSRKVVKKISNFNADIEIKAIGGNWCSDTRREIPRLCRVLYDAGVPASKFHYFKVDRDKKAVNEDFAASRKIGAVAEMIVYYKGRELGSIIETPEKTIEEDLLKLLKNAE
jgi:hypothetical protein